MGLESRREVFFVNGGVFAAKNVMLHSYCETKLHNTLDFCRDIGLNAGVRTCPIKRVRMLTTGVLCLFVKAIGFHNAIASVGDHFDHIAVFVFEFDDFGAYGLKYFGVWDVALR